jgi:predicted DNA-binding transcriptional regulator AlpA
VAGLKAFLETRLAELVEELTSAIGHSEVRLLDERRVAEVLGCNPRTVRRLERAGIIPPALRIGGMKRWRATEVETWLATSSAGSPPRPYNRSR